MAIAPPVTYLLALVAELLKPWPDNRTLHLVCHGHSVPAGYFRTPDVRPFSSYPHLLARGLKERFPFAVLNVIVTAIGGENSPHGAARFATDVLALRPALITLDYGLNDRRLGLPRARAAWTAMITASKDAGIPLLLLTPTLDITFLAPQPHPDAAALLDHAAQIRALANEHAVGLVDATAAWTAHLAAGGHLHDLLSQSNHPNELGHTLVARELLRYFPMM